jgi:hypothetical protein
MTLSGKISVSVAPAGTVGLSWSDLYIKANIELTAGRSPNKAKVEIYNLSQGSLEYLNIPGQVMQVLAGTDRLDQIFYGDLSRKSVETKVAEPNQVTTINAADGQRIFRDRYWVASYPAGTTRSQVLADLLAQNAIARGYISPAIPELTNPSSWAFAGLVRDALDQLYPEAKWSIQRNTLHLVYPGETPLNTVVVTPQTGLLGSPEKTDKGMKCKLIFDAQVTPGMGLSVTSRLMSGLYRVTKVTHDLDTEMATWETSAVGVKV